MNLSAHVNSLYTKKTELESEIEFETKRPLPNFIKLSELKKKKLSIKTEIFKLLNQRKTA